MQLMCLPYHIISEKEFDWIPYPEMDMEGEHYKKIKDVYGKGGVTEKEVPSKIDVGVNSFKNNILLTQQTE